MIRRGEIYWVEFDPVKGSEQGGLRPALIVQNDTGNRFSPTTVVVAITRTIPSQPFPFFVIIEPSESGLPVRSGVNCVKLPPFIIQDHRVACAPREAREMSNRLAVLMKK